MHVGSRIILFLICLVNGQQKMMKIFGKVLDANLDDGVSKPNAVCVEECFQKSDCILVFMNSEEQCLSFVFNSTEKLTVVETAKTDNLFVAFKTQFLLNQCPAYESIELSITVGGESIPWIKNGNEYTFKKCVGEWKMFKRVDNVTVCMQTFEIGATSLEEAQTVCEGMGPYKLTGVQTEAELKWILGRLSKSWDEYYEGFWIDAKRQTAYSGQNDTHFDITDEYTQLDQSFYRKFGFLSGRGNPTSIIEDCLIVCRTYEIYTHGHIINDVPCTLCENGPGVVCGYQLV